LALLGVLIMTVSTVPFALMGPDTSISWLSAVLFVRGAGTGLAFISAMAASYAALDRSEISDAAPQLNVVQRLGSAMGTALLAVILARALVGKHTPAGMASAYGAAFWCATALTAIAVVPCVLLLRAERARRRRASTRLSGVEVAENPMQT
jgi:hypothetical protein